MDQRPAVELELVDLNEQLLEGAGGRDELLFHERHPFPLMAGRMRLDPAELRTAVDIPSVALLDTRRREDFPDLRLRRNDLTRSRVPRGFG